MRNFKKHVAGKTVIRKHFAAVVVAAFVAANSMVPSADAAAVPYITAASISLSGQTVEIDGSGFGSLAPYTGDGKYLSLSDVRAEDGWGAGAPDNLVTLAVSEWSDTQIRFWFAGDYGGEFGKFTVRAGDPLQVSVTNPQSGATTTVAFVAPSAPAPSIAPTVTLGSPSISGLTVTLGGSAVATTPGASIASIAWSWGDGSFSTGSFPQAHQYAGSGNYTITVTATDTNGLSATQQTSVSLVGQPAPPVSLPSSSQPTSSVLWSVPLAAGSQYLSIPCTIDGRAFSSCRLDTASPFSAVLAPSESAGLNIADSESFDLTSLTGSTSAYAGDGSIELAGRSLNGFVTVDNLDAALQPDLGLPTVRALCANDIVIDQAGGNLSCDTAPPSGPVQWSVPLAAGLEYLSIPCTIDGTAFASCRLDTASPYSAVLSANNASGLNIADQEGFQLTSLTGSTPAYAGDGSIQLASRSLNGYVTVDTSDTTNEPDLGLPTVTALCSGRIVIDQPDATLSCSG